MLAEPVPFVPTLLRALPLAKAAVEYAASRHAGQRRESDRAAFILHPLEVAALLRNTGHAETLVAAGILHDVVENTDARLDELAGRFGPEVASIVGAMTEDPAIEDYETRKADLRDRIAAHGAAATAVFAADKVAKVRELRAQATRESGLLHRPGVQRKVAHYFESLEMLEHHSVDQPLVRQLRFELEAIGGLPPDDDAPGTASS